MLGDSTNAERPGVSPARSGSSARHSARSSRCARVASSSRRFASNVHRMQQAIDVAVETGRKVCVVGRSMRKNLNIARNLGYMEVPDDDAHPPGELESCAPHEALILCTGSQGEPMSALTRIAYNDHPAVTRRARRHGDHLREAGARERAARARHDQPAGARLGAEVLHQEIAPVHVSGHGNSEEIRTMLGARAAEGGDAGARRVPDAGRARAAGAGRRRAVRARSCSPRTARSSSSTNAGRGSSTRSRPASRSSTGSEWGTCTTSRCATGAICRRTAS